ncbi:hypothetical protein [Tenacibaculum aiptasiae]|uniref:hypothetical protein n=1 Tax=Tenacibaculum aiptasiae TaxID=426481 RepID=UPI00232B2419|nr:hypothetical protein [Tenacibaculum aiptasiae]
MKKILLVVLLFTTLSLVSQKKEQPSLKSLEQTTVTLTKAVDSLKKELTLLKTEFKKAIKENTKTIELNKKFEKRLTYLETREDSFSSSLGLQTGIFSTIVTVLLLIIGYFSWFNLSKEKEHIEKLTNSKLQNLQEKFTVFRNQILDQFESKKQTMILENNLNLKKLENLFNEKTSKLINLEEDLLLTMGNLNAELSNKYYNEKDWEFAIFFSLKGAKHLNDYVFFNTNEDFNNQEREDLQAILVNLDNCLAYIQNVKETEDSFDTKRIKEILESIITKNSTIKDKLAEIRIKLKEITKKN